MNRHLEYRLQQPGASLAPFVDSFWILRNDADAEQSVIGLPDGRIDLFFTQSASRPFGVVLIGLATGADEAIIPAQARMFAISFKLPAAEYILHRALADLVNKAIDLPDDFWDFGAEVLNDFDAFCERASQKLHSLLPTEMDERKRRLFEAIYASKGELSVQELAELSFWSARQINRYFNDWFGISLKTYCSILRFRASLEHIAQGRLFPELDFADQNHFIKEVKKFSGAVPKELFRNHNDRFILLSALRR